VTHNPNRAWGGFDLSRKFLRGRLANLSRTRLWYCQSFKVLLQREEILGGLLPFSTEPGARNESESRDPHPSAPSHEGPENSPKSGREAAQENAASPHTDVLASQTDHKIEGDRTRNRMPGR
jgi:hypothetical protein